MCVSMSYIKNVDIVQMSRQFIVPVCVYEFVVFLHCISFIACQQGINDLVVVYPSNFNTEGCTILPWLVQVKNKV